MKTVIEMALEALENSVDLVSNEARNAEELYGKYPTRIARIQGLVALEVAHEKAITKLKDALEGKAVHQENYMDNSHDSNKPVAWFSIAYVKPHEGQMVLVWYKGFAYPDTAVWLGKKGWARDEEFDRDWDEIENPITHWMPLPPGPDYRHTSPQTSQQSCYCPECERLSKELAELKPQQEQL